MRYIDAEPGSDQGIRGLTAQVEDGWCVLRWLWPRDAQAVYIQKLSGSDAADPGRAVPSAAGWQGDQPPSAEGLKLYTREEYKAANGYRDRLDHFGKIGYVIHLVIEQNGEQALLRQPEGDNRIEVSAGRAKIHYSIRQQGSWLSKRKTVRIEVHAEVPVARDVLCYVKKEGSYPANREDGIVYPFAEPFQAGRNELPAIEMGKNEYVRLFFTDGRTYGQMYELILE
ncbi:hypothetical protein [Paenibacillus bovis]|uniref:Beta-mannanase n=1 Tax=Paenibacillus bovis TaxID=1616788 RepID=A0A172ZCG3_9BACL|nr:hypothetical protein [Paenibacillus bovis]ANF95336.1 beta-mannanase [Paenibacillus bovis]